MITLRKLKQVISLLMLGVILLSAMLPGIAAANPLTGMRISFTPDKSSYAPGDTVQLTFSLNEIQMIARNGLTSAAFTVSYDSDVLEAPEVYQKDVNYTTALASENFNVSAPVKLPSSENDGRIRLEVAGVTSSDILNGTRDVVTLQFRVKEHTAASFGAASILPGSARLVTTEGQELDPNSLLLLYYGGGIHVSAPRIAGIDSFSLNGYNGVIDNGTGGFGVIKVTVPYGTRVEDMQAVYHAVGKVSVGGVPQTSGEGSHDFTKPVLYTVMVSMEDTQSYMVIVEVAPPDSRKAITSFTAGGNTGIINEANKTITVETSSPHPWLWATTFTTTGALVKYNGTTVISSTDVLSYEAPVTLTVVAQDGSSADYTVTVKAQPSSVKVLTAFSIGNVNATIKQNTNTISMTVPFGTDVTALTPAFTFNGAKVTVEGTEQISGQTPVDFSIPVTYTVVAEDGSTQNYTVTVTTAPGSPDKALNSVTVGGMKGTISYDTRIIDVTVPSGADLSALTLEVDTTAATVQINTGTFTSGDKYDFTKPATLKLIAQDGTFTEYMIKVTKEGASAPETPPTSNPTPTPTPAESPIPASTPDNGGSNDGYVAPVATLTPTPKPAATPAPSPSASPAPAAGQGTVTIKYADKAKLAAVLSKAAASTGLTDVTSSWAGSDIKLLEAAGIIKGYTDKTFRPEGNMSRAEFATILWRILGEPAPAAPATFTDVQAEWSAPAIARLTQLGIINGYADGTFRPDAPVSHAEMITLLMRMLDSNVQVNNGTFPDLKGNWAESNIAKARTLGIIQSTEGSAFQPDHKISRAETAAILVRTLKLDAELQVLLNPQMK